jgi:hypothetical protein
MTQHQTSRTLVKSAPELWAECSDAASLARHLGAFGEIRITKLEPETAVAWEGTAARGTVKLEPSGWGTRVTLTMTEEQTAPVPVDAEAAPPAAGQPAATAEPSVVDEPAAVAEPPAADPPAAVVDPPVADPPAVVAEPEGEEETEAPVADELSARPGLFSRLMMRFRGGRPEPELVPMAAETVEAAPEEPAPVVSDAADVEPEATEATESAEPVMPAEPEPAANDLPEPDADDAPDPVANGARQGEAALAAALDSLGRAHHRPYSRA